MLDRGYLNTAVIQSEITYIDGEAGGKLLSRGINRIAYLFIYYFAQFFGTGLCS